MKTYILIYEDRKGNELQTEKIEETNIKQARILAAKKLANSMINDLHRIKVRKVK